MAAFENQLKELFDKPQWTEEDYRQFLELTEKYSPLDLQTFFLENYIDHLPKVQPENKKHADKLLQQIHERAGLHTKVVSIRRAWRWVAAAAIILVLGSGAYFAFFRSVQNPSTAKITQPPADIAPGRNGAILTLSDGKKIILDSAGNGVITSDGAAKIEKLSDGQVAYAPLTTDHSPIVYNTLTTDRGRQFHVKLPDGTDVWLNSASSLRYPTSFTGKERRVEVTGEAYFEVAHDASKPFIVSKGKTEVQVLGTHFNVNAYEDEDAIRITLLQGSVNVKEQAAEVRIKPGQQAIVSRLTPNVSPITVQNTDVNDVIAWKNGFFAFRGTDIKGIMRQLSRWYDVEIVYQGPEPKETFSGKIDRSLTLSQVLKILGETRVHYQIENGRKLIILP